jgi:murein L,D-transpeptidase YcbB/YkuD
MLKRAEAEQFRFRQELSIKEAEINKDKLIREMEVEKERYLIQKMQEREKAEIDKDLALEVARIVRDIEITRKERERIEEEKARLEAEAVKRRSMQLVITAEKKAEMERERELANINYIKELEIAELKAKAMERLAEAKFIEGEKEAQVIYKRREAENVLDTKFIVKDLVEEFIRSAPGIFRELMEPARNIESIRVLNINGAGFGGSGGDGGDTVSRVIGSIVSASAILPLVREAIRFSNLDGDELIKKVMEYIPSVKEALKKESKEGIGQG